MKILSFDIGIKNLSYCLIEGNNIDDHRIIEWGIWDLRLGREFTLKNPIHKHNENITRADIDNHNSNITNTNQTIRCSCVNKNGKPCKTKPSFYESDENGNIKKYLCKKHLKTDKTMPFIEDEIGKIYKMKKEDLLKLMDDKNINIEYSNATELKRKMKEYSKIHCVHKIKKNRKCKNISLDTLHLNLYNYITPFLKVNTVDIVQIENQPVKMNATMKTIQIMLYSIIKTHYYINDNNENREISVDFLNAKFKGTVYDGPKVECNIMDPYKRRKQLSIIHTEHYLKESKQFTRSEYFKNHKKQDDLADGYLMCLYYLKMKNNVR
jgi:hypothetical protein